jgi:chromosome segregation ATPase
MHSLQQKKANLSAQIAQDAVELKRVDEEIASYRRRLEEVQAEVREKRELRDRLKKEVRTTRREARWGGRVSFV